MIEPVSSLWLAVAIGVGLTAVLHIADLEALRDEADTSSFELLLALTAPVTLAASVAISIAGVSAKRRRLVIVPGTPHL